MNTIISDLFTRAERAGALLLIGDDQDRVVQVNRKHAEIYDFTDYSEAVPFEQHIWSYIRYGKGCDPAIYNDPQGWVGATRRFREIAQFSQFIVRHSDGRTMYASHERLRGAANWFYQVRVDITNEVKERFKSGDGLLGPGCWDAAFTPLTRTRSVSVGNALEAMPAAAGLIMERGKLLDANGALLSVLREGDGLVKVGDRVSLQKPSEQRVFLQRLAGFFQPGGRQEPVAMRVSRRDSGESYFIRVASFPDHEQGAWNMGHVGLLTVASSTASPSVDAGLLIDFLELTRAEAEVAVALAAGTAIAEIAAQRGVRTATVYANIKSISEKTGFGGASEIARRVCDLARIFGSR